MAPTRQKNPTAPQVLVNGHDADTQREDDSTVIEVDGADSGEADKLDIDASGAVDPGVAALQAQLDEQKRRADAAEAEAERLRNERQATDKVLTDSRLLVIESTISSKEAAKAAVIQRLKDAKESGDTDAEITATDELQQLNLDLKTAKLGKDRLEQQLEETKAAPADKLEQWFEANNIGRASRDWLRAHPDYLEDEVKNAELTLADRTARRAGLKPNTPEYFAHIEERLGMRGDKQDEPEAGAEPVQQQRAAAPAPSAPVSRGAGPGGARATSVRGITETAPGKYRVTAEIAEAAAMSGISVADYVKEALKLQRGSDGQLH